MDRAQQATLTGTQVEIRDKQEGGDVDMTTATDKREAEELERRARTMSKVNVELSRKSKETPWGFTPWMLEEMVIAATEPWQQPSSWRQEIRLRRRKRMLLSMKRPCGLELLRGSRRKGKFKDSFAVDDKWTEQMEAGPIPRRTMSGLSRVPGLGGIDGPGYIAAATVLERRILVLKFLEGGVVWHCTNLTSQTPRRTRRPANTLFYPLFLRDQHLTTVIPCSHPGMAGGMG